ncbi:hypothetical protein V8C37DRAFT_339193 [Trichoderma ceciliae]
MVLARQKRAVLCLPLAFESGSAGSVLARKQLMAHLELRHKHAGGQQEEQGWEEKMLLGWLVCVCVCVRTPYYVLVLLMSRCVLRRGERIGPYNGCVDTQVFILRIFMLPPFSSWRRFVAQLRPIIHIPYISQHTAVSPLSSESPLLLLRSRAYNSRKVLRTCKVDTGINIEPSWSLR